VNPWRPFPLIRLLLPVIAGVTTGLLIVKNIHIPLIFLALLTLFMAFLVFNKRIARYFAMRWVIGFLIFSLLTFLAYEITIRKNDLFQRGYFMKPGDGKRFYLGELIEPAVQKQKSTKVVVNIVASYNNGSWKSTVGKALIYLKKDSRSENLFYGDRILFYAAFTEPGSAAFPGSFDQKRFLANQQIYYVSYTGSCQWKTISYNGIQDLVRLALSLRNKLLQIFRDHKIHGREFAVSAALLLGCVDEIDQGLMRDYSATGAMHILSVSGMHVGVIFLVLDKLLGFLSRSKYGMVIKTILIILMIWFYAMITGLSPAVLRASVMISLVAAGKAMKRQPDILNILAASFIILLIREPPLIFNVGFQLSYIAVAGIVLLYKPVYDLYITSNFILDKVWSIVAVSLAAQLSTFPLSLYYFHQFPNYFMITNILVVPLSTLIIYIGVMLLILGSVPLMSVLLAKLLIALVWILNNSIHFIEGWPFAVTRGVHINLGLTICIYLLILAMVLFLFYKNKINLFIFFILSVILSAGVLYKKVQLLGSARMIIYGARNLPAVDFISGGASVFLYHPEVMNNDYFSENHLITYEKMKIRKSTNKMLSSGSRGSPGFSCYGCFYKKDGFIRFFDKRIYILNRKLPKTISRKFYLDIIIIYGNPAVTIDQIRKIFEVREIIVDPSNSRWRSDIWKKEGAVKGASVYVVNEKGACVIDL